MEGKGEGARGGGAFLKGPRRGLDMQSQKGSCMQPHGQSPARLPSAHLPSFCFRHRADLWHPVRPPTRSLQSRGRSPSAFARRRRSIVRAPELAPRSPSPTTRLGPAPIKSTTRLLSHLGSGAVHRWPHLIRSLPLLTPSSTRARLSALANVRHLPTVHPHTARLATAPR